jgi:hypothetical protein
MNPLNPETFLTKHAYNFPLSMIIDLCCFCGLLNQFVQFYKSRQKLRNPLYFGSFVVSAQVLFLLMFTFICNLSEKSAWVRTYYTIFVHIVVVQHILVKFSICILLVLRTYMVIRDKRQQVISIATTCVLSIGLMVSLISLVYWHIQMVLGPMEHRIRAFDKTSKCNVAQLIIFSLMIFGNTVLIILYIGRHLIENEGYLSLKNHLLLNWVFCFYSTKWWK